MSAIVSDRILRTRHNKLKRCGKQRGPAVVTRRKSGQKPQDVVGYKNGLLCSQVLLFSGKSGTLLQQDAIGMRKVSGFALFAIKSHRVCSFSKNGTEGAKKQKAGLIPQYPMTRTDRERAASEERSSRRSPAHAPSVNSKTHLHMEKEVKRLVYTSFRTQQNQTSIGALMLLHSCWSTHTQTCVPSRKSRTHTFTDTLLALCETADK